MILLLFQSSFSQHVNGGSVTLTSSPDTSYLWSTGTNTKSDTTTVVINALPPEGGTFSISYGPDATSGEVYSAGTAGIVIMEYNCPDISPNNALQSIVVNKNPISIPGPDQELYNVSETKMKAELSDGETGEWSIVSGTAKIINSHSPTSQITKLHPGVNKFQWKVNNGYSEASSFVVITIKELHLP